MRAFQPSGSRTSTSTHPPETTEIITQRHHYLNLFRHKSLEVHSTLHNIQRYVRGRMDPTGMSTATEQLGAVSNQMQGASEAETFNKTQSQPTSRSKSVQQCTAAARRVRPKVGTSAIFFPSTFIFYYAFLFNVSLGFDMCGSRGISIWF